VIEEELQPAEKKLGGDDVQIEREVAEAQGMMKVVMLQEPERGGGEKPHDADGQDIAREGVALADVGAEIDEVIPDEEERGAHGHAARGHRPQGQLRVGVQPLEGDGDEEVIDAGPGDEPEEAHTHGLAAGCGIGVGGFGRQRKMGQVAWMVRRAGTVLGGGLGRKTE